MGCGCVVGDSAIVYIYGAFSGKMECGIGIFDGCAFCISTGAVRSGVCGGEKKGCLIYQAPRCIIIIESESDVKSDLPSVIALRNSNALVGGCYFFLL